MPTATVIYHGNCPDGFTAAWLMYKCIGDWYLKVDLVPASYQTPPPDEVGTDVFLVDFCYEPEYLRDLAKRSHNLTILDHHETASEWVHEVWPDLVFSEWDDELHQVLDAKVLDQNHSGAMLAQLWTGSNVPFVRHVEDRDLWRHQFKETEQVVQAMLSYDYTLENWDKLVAMGIWELRSQGESIVRYRDRLIAQVVDEAYQTDLLGHEGIWVAGCPYTIGSDVAGILAERHDPERFAATYVDKPNGIRKWGARSVNPTGMNVAALAKPLGGGGHPHAAGWALPRSEP